jgi:uncharacterized iron-regulated protein
MQTTKLNPIQLQLLQLFSLEMSEKELAEIKAILMEYYDNQAQNEIDKIWEQKGMNQQIMEDLLNTHIRSSYKTI